MNTEAILTKRETEIAELLAWGAAKKEVADHLCISTRTVENTARNIYEKIGIQKATELSVWYFCTKHGVNIDLSPLKRLTATLLIAILLTYDFAGNDVLRAFRSRRVTRTEVRAASRRRDEDSIHILTA